MASELSDYLANAILNYTNGDAMPAAPADVYVALFNGNPTGTGAGGTEVTTDIRAAGRLAVTWAAVAGRAMASSADIDFGDADAAATVTHCALFDAAVAGNMFWYSPLDNTRNILLGDPVVIPTGDIACNFN